MANNTEEYFQKRLDMAVPFHLEGFLETQRRFLTIDIDAWMSCLKTSRSIAQLRSICHALQQSDFHS